MVYFAVPLFLTFVSWLGKDSLMIIVGVSSSAACFFVISLATNTSEIFMTAVLGVLTGAIFTGYKSFLPRMVRKDQTARLSTINSIVQSFCPILSALIFNNIFNSTLDYWPGMAFLLGGILQVIVVIGQIVIHILMHPQWKRELLQSEKSKRVLSNLDD
ncbi:hypothetical protein WR25_09395 isoform G [Diploscapter pachys]|uniref:Major facilitator superfamily (MFS) profile domain-containing protein n=1 Tax=Diploscapter pachys TaxID=2018661 RepID=A0A2A2JUL7_9BILA|nr:hypothetical protein WR25_09395 isoform G [Diploscapter pachys]